MLLCRFKVWILKAGFPGIILNHCYNNLIH
jgi:hypothetical protein